MAAINGHGLTKKINGPADSGFSITTSDSTDLANTTRWIYVGGTGDVKVDLASGNGTVTFKAMPIGMYPIAASRVYATGTTATLLLGLY